MQVLICNAGSSSLKVSLFEADDETLLADLAIDWTVHPARLVLRRAGQAERRAEISVKQHGEALARIIAEFQAPGTTGSAGFSELGAIGHRVVHGGSRYTSAVRITDEVKQAIGELSELAPLHNPAALEVIAAAEQLLPGVPQVAAFDTSFHATLSEAARTYPVPRAWTRDWGLRRFGFHGLSHAYCAGRAAEMLDSRCGRLVIAHLGNGASISAVRDGVCVDTSMGFTPLEGLMMGTRSGTVDPGMLLYLLRVKGLDAEQLDHALNYESGLLGVSGVSSDMRQILAAAADQPHARLALEIYVHRIRQTIGAMAATLGGIDCLIFTAGVGENAAEIRRRVCNDLGFLGLELDPTANAKCRADADIAAANSKAGILVIATREDLTILRETRRVVGSEARSAATPVTV